jgi:DnaJ-class molecular chaperone
MNTAALHHIDCEWQHEQYDHECTCGAAGNLRASKMRDNAREATMFVDCDHCDGSGVIARRVTVYEHGCGVPHDDTDEQPCPECDGTGQREVEAERRLTAERGARIREVAELREQKDAWINRLEAENERLRVVLERIASQTFLDDPTQARLVARQALTKKCPTCGGIGVSENEPQGCGDCLGTGTI